MGFATTGKDETLHELASRLFGVGARSKVARTAAERLVELNPELKDIHDVPEGSPIEVPELDDPEPAQPLPGLTKAASGTLVAALRVSSDVLEDALAATADEARSEASDH